MNVVEDRNDNHHEEKLEENEDHQFLRNLGGSATHLIGNDTLDTIHLSYES